MPQHFDPPPDWHGRGKVTIVYKDWYRNLPIIGETFAYNSGEKVAFFVRTEKRYKPHDGESACNDVVREEINGIVKQWDLYRKEEAIEGSRIEEESTIKYYLWSRRHEDEPRLIFSTKVLHQQYLRQLRRRRGLKGGMDHAQTSQSLKNGGQ